MPKVSPLEGLARRLLPLLVLAVLTPSNGTPLRATWINVWMNSNQPYVPGPGGLAAHNITCAWGVAAAKYNVSLPASMTLALSAAQTTATCTSIWGS